MFIPTSTQANECPIIIQMIVKNRIPYMHVIIVLLLDGGFNNFGKFFFAENARSNFPDRRLKQIPLTVGKAV